MNVLLSLPQLGMGTWGMGGKFEREERNADESVELLRYGFELGFRLVDVAERYGEGLTEEIVGRALSGRKRSEFFIISKVWKDRLRYDDVLRAAEGSLQRLGAGYIDLYLVHWPNPEVPLRETMRALQTLRERAVIRHIGMSNFTVPLLEEARALLKSAPLAANEAEYNLAARDAEKDVIPYCKAHGIQFIAYRPLAKGALLSEKNAVLDSLAEKYRKMPAQVALNWITRQGITAIPKAGSREHLEENWGAVGWELSEEDARLFGEGPLKADEAGSPPARG